ncbi:MAG: galactosyltransferase-related protein [Methanobacteriota archaeon]
MVQKHKPQTLIVSRVRNLPDINLCKVRLPRDYPRLARLAEPHRPGVGGLMSATRAWWHRVRGFDERMKAWGAEDNDMKDRAIMDGLKPILLDKQKLKNVTLYHQYHKKSIPMHKEQLGIKKYEETYSLNLAIWKKDKTIVRNDNTWGCFPR